MSENRQFVENPLHLTDIFSGGVYYFKEEAVVESELLLDNIMEIENPNLDEEMIQLSILNLFLIHAMSNSHRKSIWHTPNLWRP